MKQQVSVGKSYTFAAAHYIPTLHDGHKCRAVHGHTYRAEVSLSGEMSPTGILIDFAELDLIVNPIIGEIDHTLLNGFRPLDVPTVEVIANYLFHRIEPEIPTTTTLDSVRVWESDSAWGEVSK